jgi:hypothetical protein
VGQRGRLHRGIQLAARAGVADSESGDESAPAGRSGTHVSEPKAERRGDREGPAACASTRGAPFASMTRTARSPGSVRHAVPVIVTRAPRSSPPVAPSSARGRGRRGWPPHRPRRPRAGGGRACRRNAIRWAGFDLADGPHLGGEDTTALHLGARDVIARRLLPVRHAYRRPRPPRGSRPRAHTTYARVATVVARRRREEQRRPNTRERSRPRTPGRVSRAPQQATRMPRRAPFARRAAAVVGASATAAVASARARPCCSSHRHQIAQ